jgi:hypothetical protein
MSCAACGGTFTPKARGCVPRKKAVFCSSACRARTSKGLAGSFWTAHVRSQARCSCSIRATKEASR